MIDHAKKGDVDAQALIGFMYDEGQGVQRDYKQAIKWYKLAAGQGDAYSQLNLGLMYDSGHGVKQDFKKAASWYKKAAEQGNADAQYNLGLYMEQLGPEQDDKEAIKWLKLAALQGHFDAWNALRILFKRAKGTQQDYQELFEKFKAAAKQGKSEGQIALGNMYDDGLGVNQSDEEAIKWYKRAAEQADVSGIALLISKVYIGQSKIDISEYIEDSQKIAVHVKMEERDEDQQEDQHLNLSKKDLLKWITTVAETGLYEGFPKVKPVRNVSKESVVFGDEMGGLDFSVWLDKIVFYVKNKKIYIKELYLTQDLV